MEDEHSDRVVRSIGPYGRQYRRDRRVLWIEELRMVQGYVAHKKAHPPRTLP